MNIIIFSGLTDTHTEEKGHLQVVKSQNFEKDKWLRFVNF